MRYLKYFIAIPVFLVCSCTKKFLDVPDTATLLRQSYVTDLNKAADALNGVYILLAQNFYYGHNQIYPDLVADNIKPVTPTSPDLNSQYNWVQLASTSTDHSKTMNATWLDGYQVISYCNFLLAKAEEYRNQNTIKADDIKAQVLAIRVLVHFTLVNIFAQSYGFTTDASHLGVPYVTNYDWTKPSTKRNTVAEVYNNMISDLKGAIPLFNSTNTNKLYLTQNAAKALLARIYLFKGDFFEAKNLATELSTSVPIMTNIPSNNMYPDSLFRRGDAEAFFQMMASALSASLPSLTGNYQGTYYTYFQGIWFGTAKYFIATADIASALKQNPSDLRKVWIASNGDIVKYPSEVVPGPYKTGSYYLSVIRSSEMVLTASEAYAHLNNEDSARYYLNQIRTRANIPAVSSSVTGAALRDSIYLERRRELCFEGLRMFDLQRWKKGVNRQDAWSSSALSLPYPSDKAIAPLPQNDITMLGLTQNPTY